MEVYNLPRWRQALDFCLKMVEILQVGNTRYNTLGINRSNEAKPMCGFVAVSSFNPEDLTEGQKEKIKKDLEKRKKEVQARLNEIEKALKFISQSKGRSKRRLRR